MHTRLRGLINPSFLPRQIERLRPEVEQLSHQLIDQFAAHGSTDLIASFAEPVPVMVIARFLGVPDAMAPQLLAWSHDMVAMYQARRDRDVEDRAVAATLAFSAYMRGLLAEHRVTPGEDFLSQLLTARDDEGTALTEDELVTTAILLLNAGHEATVHAIGNGLQALLTRDGPATFLTAPATCTEEMLRFDTPLHMFSATRWRTSSIAASNCGAATRSVSSSLQPIATSKSFPCPTSSTPRAAPIPTSASAPASTSASALPGAP